MHFYCELATIALMASAIALASFAGVISDAKKIFVQKVQNEQKVATPAELNAMKMEYRTSAFPTKLAKTIRKAAANGLTANFSVQDGSSQEAVWSENFENLSAWTVDKGEGSAIDISATTKDSKNCVKLEGPYQKWKRTVGTLTSSEIAVPSNGELHASIYAASAWVSYAVLTVEVSADDFATSATVWTSADIEGKGAWRDVSADLSAFAGKNVKIRFTYGAGKGDDVGGYMADYYVADLNITGVGTVDQITVKAGDEIKLTDLSAGNPTAWEWTFEGATPATSNEQNPTIYYERPGTYDITLKVKDAEGEDVVTKEAFVVVEGVAPVAGTIYPAEFRDITTRMRMIAPLVPVTYKDNSTGFPTENLWSIYSEYELATNSGTIFSPTIYEEKDVTLKHEKLNKWYVTHIVNNESGYTYEDDSVMVKFGGMITNFRPEDGYQTNFTDGNLTMPGANKMNITAYAEKFSKPAHPMVMSGCYVNFTKAQAEGLADQIANVDFTLYSSKDGKPDQPLDLIDSWTVSELNYAMNNAGGSVELQFSKKYVINDEFFIVIDGIPEKNDSLECAIAMAPMRDKGNTAYMLNKGEWREFTGYFQAKPAGQTSLAVFPVVQYSCLIPAKVDEMGGVTMDTDTLHVTKDAGQAEKIIFSPIGYEYVGSDADWCRVVGEPGEYTADTLNIHFDAIPEGVESRTATLEFTDGIDVLKIYVVQDLQATAIDAINKPTAIVGREVFDLNGRRVNTGNLPKGIYIIREGQKSRKVVR